MKSSVLEKVLERLATEKGIFQSEADFQFSLAWAFQEADRSMKIILEYKISHRAYLDILLVLADGTRVGLELKYFTSKLTTTLDGVKFPLKDQAATDHMRYDAIKDIKRLEDFSSGREISYGYTLWLTNVASLWNNSKKRTLDYEFRIHEGRLIRETLSWDSRASSGTIKGRPGFTLGGQYYIRWHYYPWENPTKAGNSRGNSFKYCITEVGPRRSS